jgi:hypothetical protein
VDFNGDVANFGGTLDESPAWLVLHEAGGFGSPSFDMLAVLD